MKITMMKAGYGDCFLIELTKDDKTSYNILVDGGTGNSYDVIEKNKNFILSYLRNNMIHLMVLTHIDDDHVKGIQRLLKNLFTKKYQDMKQNIIKVIYNSPYATALYLNKSYTKPQKEEDIIRNGNISARSAKSVEQLLCNMELLSNEVVVVDDKNIQEKMNINENGIEITFLSPNKEALEDYYRQYEFDINEVNKKRNSLSNGNISKNKIDDDYEHNIVELMKNKECEPLTAYNCASIAFLLEENVTREKVLMLGDSDYGIVEKRLREIGYSKNNKLKLNYVKLSHHGSIGTLKSSFLEIINCSKYLISTDGNVYNHPNKKTLARIWSNNENSVFYFNYEDRINKIFKRGIEESYRLKCKKYQFTGETNE